MIQCLQYMVNLQSQEMCESKGVQLEEATNRSAACICKWQMLLMVHGYTDTLTTPSTTHQQQ
jgi:hypothetical protein